MKIKYPSQALAFIATLIFSFGSASYAQDTVMVNFTGGAVQWSVPAGYTCDIEITVAGAAGGSNAGYANSGGLGAVLTDTISVSPGDILDITVGGQGTTGNGSGGFNGGGTGFSASGNYSSAGGGGSTNVNINGTPTYIAGAGGGAGGGGTSTFYTPDGGDGGCLTGVNPGNSPFASGGGGGTQSAPGAGGAPWAGVAPGGSPGIGATGGMGGNWNTASGGGGGGGYFGGGGGGNDGCCTGANAGAGGGGGSSLTPNLAGCTQGGNAGDGYVMIVMPLCETLICAGDTTYVDFSGSFPAGSNNFSVLPALGSFQPAPGGPNVGFHPVDTTTYTITADTPTGTTSMPWVVNAVDPPTPDAGLDDSLCFSGMGYPLNGTLSNDGDVLWVLNSSNTFTGAPGTTTFDPNDSTLLATATVDLPGTYEYILLEDDTLGVCDPGPDTVFIYYSQESHTTTLVDPVCFGSTDGTITVDTDVSALSGNLGANEYSLDGGLTWQTSNVFTGLGSGVYNVTSRDYLGCDTTTTVELFDPLPILISVSNDTTICQNGTATVSALAINGNTYDYYWTHTADLNAVQPTTPTPAGTDMTIDVYAISDLGCFSDTGTIEITHHLPISLTISPNDTVCPGYDASMTVTASGGYQGYFYEWTENGSMMSDTLSTININPEVVTSYCVTVTDVCETTPEIICSDVLMRAVPNPVFTSDTTAGCIPTIIEFTNLTGSITDSLTWRINNDIFYNQPTVSYLFDEPGTYDVWLEVYSEYGCHADILAEEYITIHDSPYAFFYATPNPATIFDPIIQFNNISEGDNLDYIWTFSGGSPAGSSLEDPEVLYPEGVVGTYPVNLFVIDENNCVDSVSSVVHVNSDILLFSPNVFTPDGDEYNETWRVYIDGIDFYDFHILMYNRWGEIMWESYDAEGVWDGTYGSQGLVDDGTYVWVINCKDAFSDKKYEFRGHVTVLK